VSEDIAASTRPAVTEEWDAAWDSDEQVSSEPKTKNRAAPATESQIHTEGDVDDEIDADAWGWGDEATDSTEHPQGDEKQPDEQKDNSQGSNHALTLKENYWTSSMPKPVYDTITSIYEDGVKLATSEDTPSKPLAFTPKSMTSATDLVNSYFSNHGSFQPSYSSLGSLSCRIKAVLL